MPKTERLPPTPAPAKKPERSTQGATERDARLTEISRKRKETNELAIREAITTLEKARKPITVAGVAREAGVARQTVYNSPHAAEIQQLAQRTMHLKTRPDVQTLASQASLQRRLQDQNDEIRRLKKQLQDANVKIQRLLQEQAG